MKTAVLLLLSLSGLALAQDSAKQDITPTTPDDKQSDVQFRRLQSVTWDLQSHKLVWVVEKGVPQNGEFVPSSQERYEITPSDAMMAFGGEQRGFTEQEAAWLQHLLNVLTIYCAESVVWWNSGEGGPANAPAPSPEPPAKPHEKPNVNAPPDDLIHKVSAPQAKPAPIRRELAKTASK